ncbi:Protein of unknown function [Cotesia congregata]|uniref:Uncharacterized protein n=1 Tax=Cotesia congregata TaxID=51543 RepID=A0A8J2HNL8_COTCN|nr:Protein of unknown function [Cotesia congregata]
MSEQNQKLVKNNLLKHLLQELNLSAGSIEDILDNVLDKTFNTVDDNLGTIYKRKKFYEKNFPYVSPIQIPLNNSSSKKKQFFHYVPLKGTIKHDIFEGVLAYDLKLYLDDLVDKGWFSYKLLNH